MGKINIEDLEKYTTNRNENNNQEKIKFFSLKNNGDTAQVRFCHNDMSDIELVTMHTVKDAEGKTRKVACLREYNDPLDVCPFCKHASENPDDKQIGPVQARFFISLIEYIDGATGRIYEKKIWERGPKFKQKLLGYTKRYNPLCKQVFEIERFGNAGDTQTTYEEYPLPGTLEDFPMVKADLTNKSVLGSIIANKTAEEMNYFIENGSFAKIEKREEPKSNTQTTLADEITNDTDFFNGVTRRRL